MLNTEELKVLNKLATGSTHHEVSNYLGCDETDLGVLLRFMQAKVGAKTLPHLIHRAWELGMLGGRTLCLCVAVLGASNIVDIKAVRHARVVRTVPKTAVILEIA